ncbi:MAG TPA: hypothetical protein VFB62_23180 [Polyangiaceae bacterium]|nr:hypothetical protein [Polyangiaceae bacterium]
MMRWIVATVAGLVLATLPFWRFYAPFAGASAHMDHAPRHGGQLAMVGDHHIELVRHRGSVQVFVSDARRRPIRPREGRIVFDQVKSVPLAWRDHRLIAQDQPDAREIETAVVLHDGTSLTIAFVFSP